MKNIIDKLQVIIISILVVAFSVLMFALPDRGYSENENRSLEEAPPLSFESIISAEFTEKLGRYFADQFPMRDGFVAVKAYSELLSGKKENNGVIYCKNDTLIPKSKVEDNRLEDNLRCIAELGKRSGAEIITVPLPRTADVFSELLPAGYPKETDLALWEQYRSTAKKLGVKTVDVYSPLCTSNEYYRTDHHYTTKGAFIVYDALGDALEFRPLSENSFNISTVSEDFCGTSMRSSGFYLAKKDAINLYRYSGDDRYKVIADEEEISLYDMSKLDTTDKYAVFLGGNHSRVDIFLEDRNREKLLIIRDSFADSIAPFLAIHYDLVMIDLRYYKDSVAEIIEKENISKVLVLENISELSTAKNLTYLRME